MRKGAIEGGVVQEQNRTEEGGRRVDEEGREGGRLIGRERVWKAGRENRYRDSDLQ